MPLLLLLLLLLLRRELHVLLAAMSRHALLRLELMRLLLMLLLLLLLLLLTLQVGQVLKPSMPQGVGGADPHLRPQLQQLAQEIQTEGVDLRKEDV